MKIVFSASFDKGATVPNKRETHSRFTEEGGGDGFFDERFRIDVSMQEIFKATIYI